MTFPWTPAADAKLTKLWNERVKVPLIAVELGCPELAVRHRAVLVLQLPPRFPMPSDPVVGSRAKLRRGA